ncbi:MAG: metallophosphatase [Bacteroidia bacterium]|nr:metallophosphatase [Bacteroidia bacterium]MDW8345594.1 metallophosphatase [Bacteroidia bacterium]
MKQIFVTGAVLSAGGSITPGYAKSKPIKITILHTNDVHSRIEPFPMDGSKSQGLGGFARRATLIKRIRATNPNVLLLDAGDIIQGTPYFNFYGGEIEIKLMNKLGYDACTIGNHDFDAGIEGLDKMIKLANFPFLCANYDFKNNIIHGKVKPYKVFVKQGVRIGVFGIGIQLDGLVADKMHANTIYLNPVEKANAVAKILREKEKCSLVICLSHLGHYPRVDNQTCDPYLAQNTSGIDLIIGAHTHTFMDKPAVYKNANGDEVLVFQVGWAGINLGRVDFEMDSMGKKHAYSAMSIEINENIPETFIPLTT